MRKFARATSDIFCFISALQGHWVQGWRTIASPFLVAVSLGAPLAYPPLVPHALANDVSKKDFLAATSSKQGTVAHRSPTSVLVPLFLHLTMPSLSSISAIIEQGKLSVDVRNMKVSYSLSNRGCLSIIQHTPSHAFCHSLLYGHWLLGYLLSFQAMEEKAKAMSDTPDVLDRGVSGDNIITYLRHPP